MLPLATFIGKYRKIEPKEIPSYFVYPATWNLSDIPEHRCTITLNIKFVLCSLQFCGFVSFYEIYFWKKQMVLCWMWLINVVFLQLPAKEGFPVIRGFVTKMLKSTLRLSKLTLWKQQSQLTTLQQDVAHSRNYERGKSDNTSVENTRTFTTEFLRIPYVQHGSIPGDSTSEDVVTISGSQRFC